MLILVDMVVKKIIKHYGPATSRLNLKMYRTLLKFDGQNWSNSRFFDVICQNAKFVKNFS